MSLARCINIGGPGKIVTPTGTYVTTGDIKVTMKRDLRDLESALAGKVGKVLKKTTIEISAELAPLPIYATQLIALQPTDIGSSLFGCTDSYIKIWGRDDVLFTFKAGGLIKPPPVRFASDKNLYGEATWGVVVANEEDIATLGNVLAISSSSFSEPSAAFDVTQWRTKGGLVYHDLAEVDPEANPLYGASTEDGIEVAVEYEGQERTDDLNGWYDTKLAGVSVTVKFKPQNLTAAQLLELLPVDGPSAVPGLNLATIAKDMSIKHQPLADGDLVCDLAAVVPDADSLMWSRNSNRVGELSFIGIQSVTAGTPNPLYAFSVHSE